MPSKPKKLTSTNISNETKEKVKKPLLSLQKAILNAKKKSKEKNQQHLKNNPHRVKKTIEKATTSQEKSVVTTNKTTVSNVTTLSAKAIKKKKKTILTMMKPLPEPQQQPDVLVEEKANMEDIFAQLARNKQIKLQDEQKQKEMREQRENLERQWQREIEKSAPQWNPAPVRYDESGLPIYSEDSLRISRGGDTSECPFDCWCCF